MEPNEKIEENDEIIDSNEESSVITDFVDLVNCVTGYYKGGSSDETLSGDEWKKKAGLEDVIPKNIDNLIKRAFIAQLKKFTK